MLPDAAVPNSTGSGSGGSGSGSGELPACGERRFWGFFLASSLVTFALGLSLIACFRMLDWLFGRRRRSPDATGSPSLLLAFVSRCRATAEGVISVQRLSGKILMSISCLLSIASLSIYLVDATTSGSETESCVPFGASRSQQVDVACNVFFMTYFLLRLIASQDKLLFWLEIHSFVDYFTIPPSFLAIYLDRQWLGLRFLRALRMISLSEILQRLNFLRTSSHIRFTHLVSILLSIWLAASGFIHLVENSGDPFRQFERQQRLTYWECVYLAIVTMSTVGYGDFVCETVVGRVFIVVFISGALAMFASFVPEIVYILGRRDEYAGSFETTECGRHVIICGHITYESVHSFVRDFLHADRDDQNIKCVILDNRSPSLELQALIKRRFTQIAYFRGSTMNIRGLQRVEVRKSLACLVLADSRCGDPDAEDTASIMRVISLKNFHPEARVIVQLMRHSNKGFLLNLPSWQSYDQMICISELKLSMLAQSCLAAGFSTLVTNLFVMHSYRKESSESGWQDEYRRGAGMEVYTSTFSVAFHGKTFAQACRLAFRRLGLLLLAISCESGTAGRIVINPVDDDVIIRERTHGFFICQSEDEARQAATFCYKCSPPEVPSRAARRHCRCRAQQVGTQRLAVRTIQATKHIPSPEEGDSFDSTGLFHWCPERHLDDATLSDQVALRGHVIVCLLATAGSRAVGLANLLMPLRASSIPRSRLRDVLVLGDRDFVRDEWPHVRCFPRVFVKSGSPLDRRNLRAANVAHCRTAVILNESGGGGGGGAVPEEPDLIDKEAILCCLTVKSLLLQSASPDAVASSGGSGGSCGSGDFDGGATSGRTVSLITALSHDTNVQFVDQDDDDEPDTPLYMTQPYVCGRAFASSLLDALMSAALYNHEALPLIRLMLIGGESQELERLLGEDSVMATSIDSVGTSSEGRKARLAKFRSRITCLPLNEAPLSGIPNTRYGDLVMECMESLGLLVVGLYRRIDRHRELNRFVFTNPPADARLFGHDLVYCFVPNPASGLLKLHRK